MTVHHFLDTDQYPLPNPDDLSVTLANGKAFSKLDLSQACQQIQLEVESAKYLTITSPVVSNMVFQ